MYGDDQWAGFDNVHSMKMKVSAADSTKGAPQRGTTDAEIKDLSVENPELKGCPL